MQICWWWIISAFLCLTKYLAFSFWMTALLGKKKSRGTGFSFSSLKMFLHHLPIYIVSYHKYTFLYLCFSVYKAFIFSLLAAGAFKIFCYRFQGIWFWCPWCNLLYISYTSGSSSFLNLWVNRCHHIWKFSAIISCHTFFSPLWIQITCVLSCLKLSCSSHNCYRFFHSFSPWA